MRLVAAILCFALALPAAAAGNEQLRRAFLRLEAQTETGVSYVQYGPMVGEMRTELKIFETSAASATRPKALGKLREAASRYVEAGELWKLQLTINQIDPGRDCISSDAPAWQEYATRYPEVAGYSCPPITLLLKFIWRDAAQLARDGLALAR
jgi:hypothetical protein